MTKRFIREVPKTDHKRVFRAYNETFTGQTAASTLCTIIAEIFPDRNTDR